MKNEKIEMRSVGDIKGTIKSFKKNWMLYALLIPMVIWFLIFVYKPMSGLMIAFKSYDASLGIQGSPFVGFAHLNTIIFGNYQTEFWRAFRNTFVISLYGLVFGFPVPILLALLFSEINNNTYRKITQTLTYLPHFLSEVTITGIVLTMLYSSTTTTGVLAQLLYDLGIAKEGSNIMSQAQFFRPTYIITGIWKESGYNSIVYFAAIMGISPVMYEALKVDGGTKWQEIRYVTIPGMAPTLIIMVIMRIGKMLSVGYERVLLLYSTNVYSTADVLSTFEQRFMEQSGSYEIGAAAGIFNSVIGFALVIGANTISRKVSQTSLW
ncbi:MAG: ABC transporter permease subunit [bacterium]